MLQFCCRYCICQLNWGLFLTELQIRRNRFGAVGVSMLRRRYQGLRSTGIISRPLKRKREKRLSNYRQFWVEQLEDRCMLAVSAPTASGNQADTFLLHSLPGYQSRTDLKTVYLDFKGQNTTGTQWNQDYKTPTIFTPAYDL